MYQIAGSPTAREKLREILIVHGRVDSSPQHKPIPLELRRSDGATIGVELFHATKTDERGRAVGSLLAIADIAERARREAEVQASANAYRDLFDGAPVMLLAIDAKNTTILECNSAVAEATGYTRAELLDRSIFDLYDPACLDQAAESFRAFLHEGQSRDVQLRVRTKTGGTFSVLESSTAVADETGAILACRMTWRRVDVRAREPLRVSPARRAS
jgi:PAS domain S-box-containing protein